MLEKFLNKNVVILSTTYGHGFQEKGIVTRVDNDFIELDNDKVIAIKYIIKINSL